MYNIGIIGNGYVGNATGLLECKNIDVKIWDIVPEKCKPFGLSFGEVAKCHIVFICVPTPMAVDGSCDTSIVSKCAMMLSTMYNMHNIVIRSTVPIGFCKDKYLFMPEFLTEKAWRSDFINTRDWIIGCDNELNPALFYIRGLLQTAQESGKIASSNTIVMRTDEAELVKLVRNTFLASKVGFFNEIYDISNAYGLNYNNICAGVSADARIGSSHMNISRENNPPRGFGGTCFPKDANSLYHSQLATGKSSYHIKNLLERNEYVDAPDKPWLGSQRSAIALATPIAIHISRDDSPDNFMFYPRIDYLLYTIIPNEANRSSTLSSLNESFKQNDNPCNSLWNILWKNKLVEHPTVASIVSDNYIVNRHTYGNINSQASNYLNNLLNNPSLNNRFALGNHSMIKSISPSMYNVLREQKRLHKVLKIAKNYKCECFIGYANADIIHHTVEKALNEYAMLHGFIIHLINIA